MRWTAATLLLFTAGCTSSPPPAKSAGGTEPRAKSSAPKVTAEELTRPEGHLILGDIMLLQNGKPGLVLRRDGTVESPAEKRVLGKLGGDGRFVGPNGKLLAQLTKDGEMVLENGDYLPVTIDAQGSVRLLKENRVIRLNDDGTIEGANPDAPVVTVRGATTQTRRAAMFLLVLAAYPVRTGS